MAIIFISIRRKQKMFFWGIAMLLVSVLVLISFLVALDAIKNNQNVPAPGAANVPDITIDFTPLDSVQAQHLQPFQPAVPETTGDRGNPFTLPAIKK